MARPQPKNPGTSVPINVRTDRGRGVSSSARASQKGGSQSGVIPENLRSGEMESKKKVELMAVRAQAARDLIKKKGKTWRMFRQGNQPGSCGSPNEAGYE